MIIVGPEGVTPRAVHARAAAGAQCVFEQVYFSAPDSVVFGRAVVESRENLGRLLARESPADADPGGAFPIPGGRRHGYSASPGWPYRPALIRTTTWAARLSSRRQAIRVFRPSAGS